METREWKTIKEYQDILFDFYNGIAKITINRSRYRNAFTPTTTSEISDALYYCRECQDINVVVLTGAGDKAFCSGGAEAVRHIAGEVQPLLNEHLGVRAVLPGFLDGFQNEFQVAVRVHLHFVGVVLADRAGGAHLQRLAELVFRQRMSGGAFGCGFRFSVLELQFQPCGWIAVQPPVRGGCREDCVTIRWHPSAPPHP